METTGEALSVAKSEIARLCTSIQRTANEIHIMCEVVLDAFAQSTTIQGGE